MKITRIYVLRDPRTNEVRYVGKTVKTLADRLSAHINESGKIKTHRGQWIQSLLKVGVRPVIEEIDQALADWVEKERFWIAHYRSITEKLTNQCDGGEGVCGIVWSEERRAQHSKQAKAFFASASDEWRRNAADLRNKAHTPESRARTGKKIREVWRDPDYREHMSAAYKATWTPEKRAEYSARLKAMPTEERSRRAKKSMADPVRRQKMSEANKAAWTPEMRAAAAERARANPPPRKWTAERSAAAAVLMRENAKKAQWTPEMIAARTEKVKAAWTPEMRAAAGARSRARSLAKSAQNKALLNEKLSVRSSEDIRCAVGDPSLEGAGDREGAG
jgi:hypothetical protein